MLNYMLQRSGRVHDITDAWLNEICSVSVLSTSQFTHVATSHALQLSRVIHVDKRV